MLTGQFQTPHVPGSAVGDAERTKLNNALFRFLRDLSPEWAVREAMAHAVRIAALSQSARRLQSVQSG
jgi:hypothetical protein